MLGLVLTIVVIALVIALFAAALIVVRRREGSGQPVVIEAGRDSVPTMDGVVPVPGPVERGAPLPVILVHGLFGFDRIGVPGARLDYFRGIAKHLDSLGCHAHAVNLPIASSIPARAEKLVAAIEAQKHERVDLICHSLGGLDARYALAKLGLASRVRSLVTVGTPHRGSPIADLMLRGPPDWPRKLVHSIGIPMDAVEWLSTQAMAKFNDEITNAPGVRYACVVGGIRSPKTRVPLIIKAAHRYMRRTHGANDGLVPMSSQYWGETLAEIEADHFAQVGWRFSMGNTFDAAGLYAFIVARLGDAPLPQAAITVAPTA